MEFYGYEQPLAMLFGSFFNPTSTQMLLQSMQQYGLALREDYYKNQEKLDNFIKEYGLFTSPIEKDEENFYNLTTGGLNDMFNDAEKSGIDLLRSREGRSLILRYIMSRPYGDLAKLKQSAESAKIYNQMAGELASKGLFSEDMAKAIDGDLRNWDTLSGNGIWSKTSPVQYKSIDDMLQSTLEDLRANGYDITDRSKPGIIRRSVSDTSIDNALNKDVDDLMTMPQMKYFRDKLGMDNDQFRSYLHKHLRADLADKEEKDDYYFAMLDLAYKQANLAEERRHNRAVEAGTTGDGTQNTPPIGFTTATDASAIARYNNRYSNVQVGVGKDGKLAFDYSQLTNTMKQLADYWDNHAKSLSGGKKDRWGKNQKHASDMAKFWKRRINKYYNKNMSDAEFVSNLIKDGILDENGNPGSILTRNISKMSNVHSNSVSANGVSVINSDVAKQKALDYYDNFTVAIPNANWKGGLLDIVAGKDKFKYPGGRDSFRKQTLSGNNWSLAVNRKKNVAGGNGSYLDRMFEKFLRKNGKEGYQTDVTNVGVARIPNSKGTSDLDVESRISMPRSSIDSFFKQYGLDNDAKKQNFLKSIGAEVYTANGQVKIDDKGSLKYDKVAYVRIPITNTYTNETYEFGQIDRYMDRLMGLSKEELQKLRDAESLLK